MDFIEASDLGLITALITLGYSPKGTHKEGKRVIYTFESSEDVEGIKKDFYNNRLDVDARRFHTTMKSVKNNIYQME